MNKLFNIIFKDLKKDKSIYISLIVVFIISFLFGLFFITILKDGDRQQLSIHINNYFDSIKNGTFIPNLKNNLLNNYIFDVIIFILGFSIIGIPFIIIMLFYKSFILSFTITSLIYNFKFDGILFSFIYVFPHLIINLLSYFFMCYYSFKLCLNLFYKVINKSFINFNNYIKKYLFIFFVTVVLLSLSALYETFILPYIIKIIY